jgi:hypothetical protein
MESGQKRAADILIQWRELERAMEDPAVGEEAIKIMRAEADQLRDQYERLLGEDASSGRLPDPS